MTRTHAHTSKQRQCISKNKKAVPCMIGIVAARVPALMFPWHCEEALVHRSLPNLTRPESVTETKSQPPPLVVCGKQAKPQAVRETPYTWL